MGLLARITGLAVVTTASPALGWMWYTRATTFVPFPISSPDFSSATARKFNPGNNPPICHDMSVRTVPLDQLKTTDQETLTRQFCQGIWSGPGFEIQRRYLARKYQQLDGRWDHLWEKADLKSSKYNVGTKIADHFEVVERTQEKVLSPTPILSSKLIKSRLSFDVATPLSTKNQGRQMDYSLLRSTRTTKWLRSV